MEQPINNVYFSWFQALKNGKISIYQTPNGENIPVTKVSDYPINNQEIDDLITLVPVLKLVKNIEWEQDKNTNDLINWYDDINRIIKDCYISNFYPDINPHDISHYLNASSRQFFPLQNVIIDNDDPNIPYYKNYENHLIEQKEKNK